VLKTLLADFGENVEKNLRLFIHFFMAGYQQIY